MCLERLIFASDNAIRMNIRSTSFLWYRIKDKMIEINPDHHSQSIRLI